MFVLAQRAGFEEAVLLGHAIEFHQRFQQGAILPSGQALGPSDRALSGSGWVSMNRPETPTATAARASTGTNSRWPPLLLPCAARQLHRVRGVEHHRAAGVAHHRKAAHVGDQVVVAEAGTALADHDVLLPVALAFSTTCFMSHGDRNWPFLMFTGLPAAPPSG
jgi:hypothetical protein